MRAEAEQAQSQAAQASAGLRWTLHPLVDMGIATLTAFAGRDRPDEVTVADLERFASYAEQAVFVPSLRSHASVLYTINNDYLNPSFDDRKSRENARALFRKFLAPPRQDLPPCAYCGRAAVQAASTSGPGYRDVVPLLTGRGVMNFFPYGQHGLPLCGLCLTALQALPFGAPSCEGRALIVGADDPDQLVALVKSWLPDLRSRVQLSQASGQKLDTWRAPRTRLIERLIELERRGELAAISAGFTVYHLTNSGQGPSIAIYPLNASVVRFVRRAQAQAYRHAWSRVERLAWVDARRKEVARDPERDERPLWRNRFYEALFLLPEETPRFVRRWFLKPQQGTVSPDRLGEHVSLWRLVQLFLSEVVGMEQLRIERIRELADAIADEVTTNEDRPLFRRAFQARSYYEVRRLLIQASARRITRGQPPLLDFGGFLTVFEVGEELPRADWRLAWDLALIRLIDQLHASAWFVRHREAAEELATTAQVEREEEEPIEDRALSQP